MKHDAIKRRASAANLFRLGVLLDARVAVKENAALAKCVHGAFWRIPDSR